MGGVQAFDSAQAIAINKARLEHLDSLQRSLEGKSVLDVGCGVGILSQFFIQRNCRVTCVDGRSENIRELKSRYPGLEAFVANIETEPLSAFGLFDVVFCYGLLYHLENPIAGLQNIASVCKDLLLLETVITDSAKPITTLVDEPPDAFNQSLGFLANRPSPAYVILALSRAGFQYFYATKKPPRYPDFIFEWQNNVEYSRDGHLLRCVFIASRSPINNPNLALLAETSLTTKNRNRYAPVISVQSAKRVWLDVGARLGEKTFPSAQLDSGLYVFAFEPNLAVASRRMGNLANFVMLPLAVSEKDGSAEFYLNSYDSASSLLRMNPEGKQKWLGGFDFKTISSYQVPTIRLDTFMNSTGIREVEFLKIDTQGIDLSVVKSAGDRLGDIRKITLEVQVSPIPLYDGASNKSDVIQFMEKSGFRLTTVEKQSLDQKEVLTFDNMSDRPRPETVIDNGMTSEVTADQKPSGVREMVRRVRSRF